MANLFLSEGTPDKVLKIKVSKKIKKESNFVSLIK